MENNQILIFSKLQERVMDIKEEDKSEESKKNHVVYYKSLAKVISDIQKEKEQESDPMIKETPLTLE